MKGETEGETALSRATLDELREELQRRRAPTGPAAAAPALYGKEDTGGVGGVNAGGAGADGVGRLACEALEWEDIQGNERGLKIYQAEALLRVRSLGPAAAFDRDSSALHIVYPGGLSAPSSGFAPLVLDASCLLFWGSGVEGAQRSQDALAKGAASLEQLTVRKDLPEEERAALAAAILESAIAEASQKGYILVVAAGAQSDDATRWLCDADFTPDGEGGLLSFRLPR